MKPTKAVTVEMIRELSNRRHDMEYSSNPSLGLRKADGLLKKIMEFERAGYFVPPEYGHAIFYYKETVGDFIRT